MAEKTISSNTKKAVKFLQSFRSQGYHNLVAIDPQTEKVTGITRPVGHQDLYDFIEKHNDNQNLYYSVNEPKPDAPDDKLKKDNIKSINGVWVDMDPDKSKPFEDERKRVLSFADSLKSTETPPTYIVDSGGGIQAFWLFEKPFAATHKAIGNAEALNRGLQEKFDTDIVHNVDRIMRIPFTTNIPTKKKQGRERATAKIIHADSPTGKRYKSLPFKPSYKTENSKDFEHTDLDMVAMRKEIPDDLMEKFKAFLNRNKKAHDLYYGIIEKPSRSEYDFTLTQELKWDGFTLNETANILYHFTFGKNKDLTRREIIRCYNRVENPFEGLSQSECEKIAAQTNPILAARKQGKPLDIDLKQHGFSFVHASMLDWRYSGRPIYKDFMYEKAITVVYGQSNVGKSFAVADIAGHIALAKNWGKLKFKPKNKDKSPKQIGVAYICAEAGPSFGKRIKALEKRLGINSKNGDYFPFYIETKQPGFAKDRNDAEKIVKAIQKLEEDTGIKIGLVVVDTLATTFEGGNENSSEDMGMYIANMKYIQHYADTGILIVHHSGKDQAAGARGHSSLRAATDTELEVISEQKGERYYRYIKVKKQREGQNDMIIKFGLQVTELGKDEDDDPIDTCYVVLEDDTEFSDLVPNKEDQLSGNRKWAYLALKLYDHLDANPDIEFPKKSKTMKAALFHCLKEDMFECRGFKQWNEDECRGFMLQMQCSIFDYDNLEMTSARNVFRAVLKEMLQDEYVEKNDIYQLVNE